MMPVFVISIDVLGIDTPEIFAVGPNYRILDLIFEQYY